MADQTRKGKPKKDQEAAPAEQKPKAEKKSDVDELLDEIDEVLEVNSEEFVRSFVQKGGQALILFITGATVVLGIVSHGSVI